MLREDLSNLSDEEFDAIVKKHNNDIKKYLVDSNFIYNYCAFYLASGLKNKALWKCSYSAMIDSIFETLIDYLDHNINVDKLNEILQSSYSLKLINTDPLTFQDTKKKRQPKLSFIMELIVFDLHELYLDWKYYLLLLFQDIGFQFHSIF